MLDAEPDPLGFPQSLLQLGQRAIRLLPQQAPQPPRHLRRHTAARPMSLLHSFHLPRAPPLRRNLPGPRATHREPNGQFPQAPLSTVVGFQ
jgi:hypothetical protein